MPTPITAAVLHTLNGTFRMESLALRDPGDNEMRVRLAATGICHTDIKVSRGYANVPLPVVLGHEGAGVVERVGAGVDGFAPGDHVVLSFPSCGACPQCIDHHPAYCDAGQALSFACDHKGAPPYRPDTVHGHFFGQSAFASHVLTTPRNAVKVDKDLPLEELGPLGCGFQTGAGAVLNVLQGAPGQSLAVFGAGNVGLAAVMAARVAGMNPVIAVDRNPARLALALTLGASHVIDAGRESDLPAAVMAYTAGTGVQFAIDTSNDPGIIRQAFLALANRGTLVHSGGGGKDLAFPGGHLLHGRTVTGVIQGDSEPQVFIPQLLACFREGNFPFDRLLTTYPLAEINRAVADMEAGRVVKPVLRMP